MENEPEKILEAVVEGTLPVAPGLGISCAVLEDETRVLSQASFLNALGRNQRPRGGRGASTVGEPPVFLAAKNLEPFVSRELLDSAKPIQFRYPGNPQIAYGYKAELLPDVCEVYLKAKDAGAGVLHYTQAETVVRCEILVRALAKTGIVALVDEATGYQYIRPRQALEEMLKSWVAKDLQKWQKTFPDELYIQLYRLRGWRYDEVVPRNRPAVVGTITNDIVYSRLAPYVLDALREVTPRNEGGKPTAKYHQSLTPEQGRLRLLEHLDSVVTLMSVSKNYDQFLRFLDIAKPVQNGMTQVLFPGETADPAMPTEGSFTHAEFHSALEKIVRRP